METIKSRREFGQVFSGGRRYNHQLVRITVLKGNEGAKGRVAFVAPKRLGNAVYRNRCKRVLREAARMVGLPSDNGDVLVFATRKTHDASPKDVGDALAVLLRRSGI